MPRIEVNTCSISPLAGKQFGCWIISKKPSKFVLSDKAARGRFFTKLQFIEPMYARLVQSLPQGLEWLYEVKFDGYRCLAARDSTGVTLWYRRWNLRSL